MFAWLKPRKTNVANIERMLQAAIQHHEAGRLAEADAAYRHVIEADPRSVDALHFLGFACFQRGEYPRAVDLIARSLALNPSNPAALVNLGNAYQALGQAAQASDCFKKAVALRPAFVEAHYNLGIACLALGRRDEAAASFREAIQQQPELPEAHYFLGHLLCDDDRLHEGLACFEKALELRPDYAEARWSLALARLPEVYDAAEDAARARAEFASALEGLERWFEPARAAAGAVAVGAVQPFSLAYQELPNRELLERHGRLCARLMVEWMRTQGFAPAPKREREDRVRVGVVSAHLRDHSVWHAIVKGWFQRLDPERFPLFAFHLGKDDEETGLAKSCAAHFDAGPKSVREWVEAILRQRPDVLIYPEIGMDPTALKLASLRLAPVQIATWGHPETTGLPTIDYYLSAEYLEPPGAQANYSEKLVVLPNLGCYFEPRAIKADPLQLRELGIDADGPLLVCPGVPFKYTPQHDWIFPELARRLGRCQFVFFAHHRRALTDRLRTRLQRAFAAQGFDADRFVVFVPWLTKAGFLGLMSQAHVCLDTIGFSGFNTALQAVQAGLPLIAREGRFMRGRLASGILKRLGLQELVAASDEAYVALAEKLVLDAPYREQVVARMARARHVLFADASVIGALEEFLQNASAAAQG
jgi:protein O-GlcNAc transferase